MILALLSILAWMLTILAPCVLPVLPVIMWWSLSGKKWYKPLIIIGSASLFIVIFTWLLKASTALIAIPSSFWLYVSWGIITLYGITLVWPHIWEKTAQILWLHKSHKIAQQAKQKWTIWGDIILWASLGPIFATCSPTYALLLWLVFPQSFVLGMLYIVLYALGFGFVLTAVTYGWRALIRKLHRATAADGKFKKILWIVLIITGILIMTGLFKSIETWLLDKGIGDFTNIEYQLIEKAGLE